jgi:hypothetical protein
MEENSFSLNGLIRVFRIKSSTAPKCHDTLDLRIF